jgi:hypothetical protein
MATSGSINYTLTTRQIITFALKKLRVIGVSEDPTSDQSEDALIELNLLMKEWQRYDWLYSNTEDNFSLVADDADYTLDPQVQRVIDARYLNSDSRYLTMELLSRQEYYEMADRATEGYPTMYYVDYQRASTVMYVWPVPSTVTTEKIYYTYRRYIEDLDSLDDNLDIRNQHLSLVGYTLAERLGPDYGRCTKREWEYLVKKSAMLLNEALDDEREDEVRFIPDMRWR